MKSKEKCGVRSAARKRLCHSIQCPRFASKKNCGHRKGSAMKDKKLVIWHMDTARRLQSAMQLMRFGKWQTATRTVKVKCRQRNAGNVRKAMLEMYSCIG